MSIHTDDLRDIAMNHGWPVCAEAADEIEELEKAYELLFAENAKLRAATPEGWTLAPHYRGYANLGIGAYVLNTTAVGDAAELVISMATAAEMAGRKVGEDRDNPPDHMVQPEDMAVRLRFENVAGLDALERRLRILRADHFPEAA